MDVVEHGFSTYSLDFSDSLYGTAGAVLTNIGTASSPLVEVRFDFLDSTGAVVATEYNYVGTVRPDGVGHAAVDVVPLPSEPASLEVSVSLDRSSTTGGVLETHVEGIAAPNAERLVQGSVVSTEDRVLEYALTQCVLRLGERISGGAFSLVDPVSPHSAQHWIVRIYDIPAESAECSTSYEF